MGEWTPGPWDTYIGPDNELYVNGNDGEPVCQIDLDTTVDQQLANAYLIEAAPKMANLLDRLAHSDDMGMEWDNAPQYAQYLDKLSSEASHLLDEIRSKGSSA